MGRCLSGNYSHRLNCCMDGIHQARALDLACDVHRRMGLGIPSFGIASVQGQDCPTISEWLYSAIYQPGSPRMWAESVLIFLLLVIALLLAQDQRLTLGFQLHQCA